MNPEPGPRGPGGPGAAAGHHETAGVLLVSLAAVATYGLVFAGRVFYFGDFQAAFEPLRAILGRAWRTGLPLWSGALSNGTPLLASPFVGALYPPNLLFALDPSRTGRLLSILVVLHVLFGGWGAARLSRRIGHSRVGAAATALAFAFTGATVSGTYMVVLVCTAMWVPWVLLAVARVPYGRRASVLALAAAVGMTLLAGDPTMILAALLACAFLAPRPAFSPAAAGKIAAGLAFGVLLAAPSLLALRLYFPSTVRAGGLAAGLRLSRSLHPLEALGIIVPDAFGSRVLGGPEGILYPGLADGNGFPLFLGLYAGVCALALSGVGAMRAPLRRRLLAWIVVLVLLALGRYGPLAAAAGLPGLASFRYPSKWMLAAALPFALLVGGGVSALEGKDEDALKSRRLLMGLLAAGLIALAALAAGGSFGLARLLAASSTPPGEPESRIVESIRTHLLEGAARGALPAVVSLGAIRLMAGSGALSWLLSLVLALDLVSANRSLAPTAPARFYEERPAAVRVIEADPGGHDRVWVDESLPARSVPSRAPADRAGLDAALSRRRERLDAYAAAAYGLPLAFHVDLEALATSRYERLTGFVYSVPPRARVTLLSAGGVSHLVGPIDVPDDRLERIASLDVGSDRPLLVYRNRAVLPRARLARAAVAVRDAEMRAFLAGVPDDFFASRTIVEERDLPSIGEAWRASGVGSPGGRVRLVEDEGSRVVIRTDGGGGLLVLTDTYAPGWRARIDDRPARIFPADIAFRMVVVPPGPHVVVFDYSPWRA